MNWMLLPSSHRRLIARQATVPITHPSRIHFGSKQPLEPIRVLLVNDHTMNRETYARALEEVFKDLGLACEIIQANSIKSALEKTINKRPTFAFIDYNLDHAGYDSFMDLSYRDRQADEDYDNFSKQTGIDLAETLARDGVSRDNIVILSGIANEIQTSYPKLQLPVGHRRYHQQVFEDYLKKRIKQGALENL